MLGPIVVVLQELEGLRDEEYFLILKVSVLSLDVVQLVSQGKVVFVALLDLEDLSFQLRNEQVFLVTS